MSEKRQQLVATAYRLFNRHGFHATGIDRIWAEAGSTKRTLYRHFPTKDALIEEVLLARDREFFALLDQRLAGVSGRDARLQALFDGFAEWFGRSDFYGCNFINASAEFADPRHPVRKLVMAHSYQQPLALEQARILAKTILADDTAIMQAASHS
ncbi:TetR/AcrR family transcriptional regulator [Aeromonas veronii]|uniref:TetR/AcrR family transcriptional regulator n=1 Tax=Aeromonas veronii TaxID=654 RepID=UPI0024432A4F|nr:helix-turn-helix domain containing protein [Aeromonas veronii]